ncbi:hypothetical protein BsWGS_24410 [Bradybaena similaris]
MRGRGRPVRRINYDGNEIQRANQSLTQAVGSGTLNWLKTKFENNAMEAVPNVWEGDDGMMKHVPKFPMPPLIALSEPPDAENSTVSPRKMSAEDGSEADEMSDDDEDFEIPKPTPEGDPEIKFRQHGRERYFWIRLAKVFMKLEEINQSIIRAREKLSSEHETVRRQTCQQLNKIYKHLKVIKTKLDAAEEEYKTNEYIDVFKVMPMHAKLRLKRYHNIEGRLPVNMRCIVKKHATVRGKIKDILHKHSGKILPFKEFMTVAITELLNKSNEKDVGLLNVFGDLGEKANGSTEDAAQMDVDKIEEVPFTGGKLLSDEEDDDDDELNEGKPKKKKAVAAGGNADKTKTETEASDAGLPKEEIFWKSMTELRRRINNATITLNKADKTTLPDSSARLRKTASMAYCKQVLLVHRKIATFCRSMVRLKEEMQTENYEDKKLFIEEDLAGQGIEGVAPDNSLDVLEALLSKLKNEYLRVRKDKHDILEKFGYHADLDVINFPVDKNAQLVRVCDHSKTDINVNFLYASDEGSTKDNQNEDGQEMDQASSLDAGADGQGGEATDVKIETESVSAGAQHDVEENTAAGDEDDASEEFEEDSSEIIKNSMSMGLFLKIVGPEALTVTEQASSEQSKEEFIEKERLHWDRLQKLLRKVDRAFKQVNKKGMNYWGKKQMRMAVNSMRTKMKEFTRAFELEKTESSRFGYCKHVTYQNLEVQSQSSAKMLVKSMDQIKDRIDNLHGLYKESAKKMGLQHMLKF